LKGIGTEFDAVAKYRLYVPAAGVPNVAGT